MKTFIVLDTNFLYGGKNPIHARFRKLIDLARGADFVICVPEAVKVELIQKYKEKLVQAHAKVQGSWKELEKLTGVAAELPENDVSSDVARYSKTLDEEFQTHGITVIPMPTNMPSTTELFRLATEKAPPFDPRGQSFRDAVIWYSLKEFAEGKGSCMLIFQTEDSNFLERVNELDGEKVKGFEPELVHKMLEAQNDEVALQENENRRRRLVKVLTASHLGTFEKFIRENFRFDDGKLAAFPEEILSIDALAPNIIAGIDDLVIEGNEMTFVASVHATVTYTVLTSEEAKHGLGQALRRSFETPRQVGQVREMRAVSVGQLSLNARRYPETRSMPWLFTVECTAKTDQKERLSDLNPIRLLSGGQDYFTTATRFREASPDPSEG